MNGRKDHTKEPEIQFKPLTDGLGFHPFSDGLPYAPLSQTPSSKPSASRVSQALHSAHGLGASPGPSPTPTTGTGAVAAGVPTFAVPGRPRVSVPVAHQNLAKPAAAPLAMPATQAAPAAQPSPLVAPKFGFFYVIKRTLAFGIDTITNLGLLIAAFSLALMGQDLQPELLMNPGVALVSALFFLSFNWAVITAQEIAFSTTLGKKLFGLELRGSTSAIFLRAFFFVPSAGFLAFGLLWSIVDRRKRCWHDLIVDLQPVEVARL